MNVKDFLSTVVTTPTGNLLIGIKSLDGEWHEIWFNWPDDVDKVSELAEASKQNCDVYFSAHLFCKRQSTKANVLPSKTIQVDLDDADILRLPLTPTVLVQSSSGRHQGYWIIEEDVSLLNLERLSKKLTYAIDNCDKSGWSLGHRFRLPDTVNHKYLSDQPVQVVSQSHKVYSLNDIDALSTLESESDIEELTAWIDDTRVEIEIGPNELLETIRKEIPQRVYLSYNKVASDRSTALWALMCSAFRAGLNRDQVYWLAYHGANNKFSGLRYNGNRELAKDVARAEKVVRIIGADAALRITNIRRMKSPVDEKRRMIAQEVFRTLSGEGEFVRTYDDRIWYIKRTLGRPIQVTTRSEYLSMIMDLEFGLNPSEVEYNYAINHLAAKVNSMEQSAYNGSLSYYDQMTESLLLHTGRRDVLRITSNRIEKVPNGSYGVLFPWSLSNEPFQPSYDSLCEPWHHIVFGVGNNTIDLSPSEAETVIRTWFMFLLFRSTAISRPILALFGQPGAGKSTLFRRVYALLYGGSRGLSSVTSADDFDQQVSNDPLVVLDNVDSWDRWLADRLALSAGNTDVAKRKLYTDTDMVILKRQALVGLTAHSPKFIRSDVADRLLIIMLKRLETFQPELDIISDVIVNRNAIWGAIVKDIQTVLRTPRPDVGEVPQFRIADFARSGLWISRALGIEKEFQRAVNKLTIGQKTLALEEDGLLVGAISKLIERHGPNAWRTPVQLWSQLETFSSDSIGFRKIYKNPVALGRKIWTMQDSLNQLFNVEFTHDNVRGRIWRFSNK